MAKKEKIELSPLEVTAYWWINLIRYKVREIVISGAQDKREAKFAEIFYGYTEPDWRKVYLELVKCISQDVDSYTLKSNSDSFNQDTDKGGHERINDEISEIIGRRIPDICLAGNGAKDSIIYTTASSASVWYKSCGVTKLTTKYEPSYVLTGDEKSLDFYNLLISTIAVLNQIDSSFHSVPVLRGRFCEEYIRLSRSEKTIDDITELFHDSFNKANDKGIILGRSFEETYFPSFRDIDYVGLDAYMDKADHYAHVVLEGIKDGDKPPLCKAFEKRNPYY